MAAGGPNGVSAEGWGSAIWKAAVIVILSFVGFVLVPNWLTVHLPRRLTPRSRDAIVLAWVAAYFVALSWAFVAAQRRRRRTR